MITVFGSINVDLLMKVARLPRPGETVLCPDYTVAPGGNGANQACAAARAGGGVAMIGCVGDDNWAATATRDLTAAGVDVSGIQHTALPTGCASVWIDQAGENSIVVATGTNAWLRAAQVADHRLGPDALVLLQMETPAEENWALVERAHGNGARVILNAAPAGPVPGRVLDRLHLLVVNAIEASMVAHQAGIDAGGDPLALARQLSQGYGLTCIVTLGRDGAVASSRHGDWAVKALPVTPVDTTGAGDGFVGVLAAALDAGETLPQALRRAGVGAALACLTVGCQSAYADAATIDAHLADLPPAHRIET